MSKASAYFTLSGMNDKHDIKDIKRELDALQGVLSVSVSSGSNRVAVDFDTTGVQAERIVNRLEEMGYKIVDSVTNDNTKQEAIE